MTLIVTTAGLSASLDAANKGIKLKIKKIGFGSAGYVPNKDQTSLKSEFLRTDFTDTSVSSSTLNMNVVFDDLNQSFDAKEIGYYLEDDTLFAVDSIDGAIISSKHKGSILTESFELVLSDHLIDSITVDVIGVSRATENNTGIAKIATIDEAFDVENDSDIVTPKKLHDVLDERVVNPNLFINGCFSVNQRYGSASHSVAESNDYFADRWVIRGTTLAGGTITANCIHSSVGQYIRLVHSGAKSFCYLEQRIDCSGWDFDNAHYVTHKKITVSIGVSHTVKHDVAMRVDLTWRDILTGVEIGAHTSSDVTVIDALSCNGRFSFTVDIPDVPPSASGETVCLSAHIVYGNSDLNGGVPDGSYRFFQAKAEFGEVATSFVADDTAINLAKCQRYLWKREVMYLPVAQYSSVRRSLMGQIEFPCKMYCAPTITARPYGNMTITGAPNLPEDGTFQFSNVDEYRVTALVNFSNVIDVDASLVALHNISADAEI